MTRRLRIGATDGYTMAAVMLVMLATSILATATFAAVGADLPFARAAQDRKQAYAAAEAGVEYYLYQLTRDKVLISWQGRIVKTLAGDDAARFRVDLTDLDDDAVQLLLARITGNFKRGNEPRR